MQYYNILSKIQLQKIIFNIVLYQNDNKSNIFVRHKFIEKLPMIKKILILCISIISSYGIINAQDWSKEDSIWLINVLEGKYDLRINEDTKKAIEDGKLIIPSWMKNDEGKINDIDILRDFDNAGAPDSARIHNVDPYSMPPAVYAMYVLYMEKMDSIFESRAMVLSTEDKDKLMEALPASARNRFYYTEYGGGIGGYDFNHLLSMIFNPSYRQKAHNRKHATAYKGYYDEGAIRAVNITENERRQLRQSMQNARPTISVGRTSEFRRSGIDD